MVEIKARQTEQYPDVGADDVASKWLNVKASGTVHTTEKFLAMIEAGASGIVTSKRLELITRLKEAGPPASY